MSVNIARFQNLQQLMVSVQPTFEKMAEIHKAVNYRQEASFALEILQKSEYVMGVALSDQDSFKRAIINVAAIGLTLNPAYGLAYLVPRNKRIILDVSYKGKIALGVQCGSIKWCIAELVYKNDEFKVGAAGERPFHNYDPFSNDRGIMLGGYAVAKTNAEEYIVSYLSMKQIDAIKARSEAVKKGNGSPWSTDTEEMIKKTLIRRNSKSWPHASTHDRNRIEQADALEQESDGLPELMPINPVEQASKIEVVKNSLELLKIDPSIYLAEKLPKLVRRDVSKFEDLTAIELDQIIIQLQQICEGL